MDKLDRATINRLSGDQEIPCVSLFMPTHVGGKDADQDAIRLNNLVREAEIRLAGHWLSHPQARDLLKPAAALSADSSFWKNRSRGLAVFVSKKECMAFHSRKPLTEYVSVGNRFRVRPLLPLLEPEVAIYLLVISENHVAFYAADEQSIERIAVPELPVSLSDTMGDTSRPPVLQVHTGMHGVSGKQAAVFHGHGGQADGVRNEQITLCGQIDSVLNRWLADSTRPILLACVEPLAAIYRRKNSRGELLRELLAGNWDRCRDHELWTRAIERAKPAFAVKARKLATRYQQLAGTEAASDDPVQIVPAAVQGRVDTLFYDAACELYGECETDGTHVVVTGQSDDQDLIGLAATMTLRQRGTIQRMSGVDVPTNSPLAAIFRF